jgi:Fuc2NAc and GlcNAc transferase
MTFPDGFSPLTGLVAFAVSALLTGAIRQVLLRRSVLDIPNERSSHKIPTPRGGGVAIVAVFACAVGLFTVRGAIEGHLAAALLGGGLTISATGILDDIYDLSPKVRLSIYSLAAGWALWQVGGLGPLALGWTVWNLSWTGNVIALVGLVWMTVLYNNMDGINGIAGMEAVYAAGTGSVFLAAAGEAGLSRTAMALAGAAAGFLVWNFPVSRVFMGDAGSGFLGFVFGVLAIASDKEHPGLLSLWLTLLAFFIVDATLTLTRRLIRRKQWSEAHCSHAYQHAARRWGSHLKATSAIAAVNVCLVLPLAWAGVKWESLTLVCFGVTAAILIWIALRFNAGIDS